MSAGPARLPAWYRGSLTAILACSFLLRLAYVAWAAHHDPHLQAPTQDGAYYLDWARNLTQGRGEPPGAFYLAPLYPHVLAGFLLLCGERLSLLYVAQHVLALGTAAALARVARAHGGPGAGLAAAALFLAYPPSTYFASRLFGEPLALALVAGALALAEAGARWSAAGAGMLAGLASLARPNLLLAPLLWAAGELAARRRARAALLVAGLLLALAPVALRNLAASGHRVLVSSNGGLTAFHGNGPGASGIYTHPPGLSGNLARQQDEATAVASTRAGRPLDPVEADRWWGRQAAAARLADPAGTVRLVGRRLRLTLGSFEHGLEEHPMLDRNPFGLMLALPGRAATLPELVPRVPLVPFGLLAGLAAAGLVLAGGRGSGGWRVWTAIGVAALAPMAFYVSSRYRLPLASLLAIPAGCGAAGLLRNGFRAGRRGLLAGACGVLLLGLSLVPPPRALRVAQLAGALVDRGVRLSAAGDGDAAERYVRAGLALEPASANGQFQLGVLLWKRGRADEAERAYREALIFDPGQADAAGNLAGLLIARGASTGAIAVLEPALAQRPDHPALWTHLVVAVALARGPEAGLAVAARARARGVPLEPGLVSELEQQASAPPAGEEER